MKNILVASRTTYTKWRLIETFKAQEGEQELPTPDNIVISQSCRYCN